MTLQIDSGYFVAGVTGDLDKVSSSAPIIKYMVGWTFERVQIYCQKKNWSCKAIKE